MSRRDRNRKGKARREAESIHKEAEKMIKRLNNEGVVKCTCRLNSDFASCKTSE